MNIKKIDIIKIGDKVIFDNDKIESFKDMTSSDDKDIVQYQRLVLGGINVIGIVKEISEGMVTVIYGDGWELPIPNQYLALI